jgi:hypothetical protein
MELGGMDRYSQPPRDYLNTYWGFNRMRRAISFMSIRRFRTGCLN